MDDQELKLKCVQEAIRNRRSYESFKDVMKNAEKIYEFIILGEVPHPFKNEEEA